MAKIIILGGGIIGLCSAYYLSRNGHSVTVVDKGDLFDNCSYGNAGYVCPSHFVPLASPGNLTQGIRWMTRSESPFYIRPRLSKSFLSWAFLFAKSSTVRHVRDSAIPLRDIADLSKGLYMDLAKHPGVDFNYQSKGLLEFFKTKESVHHGKQMASRAMDLGIQTRLLDLDEVRQMEPGLRMDILGALFFEGDAHLYPNRLMKALLNLLPQQGVKLISQNPVNDFLVEGRTIKGVLTSTGILEADQFVLAAGSWSGQLAGKIGLKLPLVGGRGYSLTLEDTPLKLNHPVILTESRVALTPLDDRTIRIGGTMEITPLNSPPHLKRMQVILKAVKKYLPDWEIPAPKPQSIWSGYRPCSADGLPYIGRVKKLTNLTIATGHAMIGLSLGAATGKLVSEIIDQDQTSIDISPFDPQRFG